MVAALYISYRSLKLKPDDQTAQLGNLGELEETLKKLLDKAAGMPSAGSVGAASPELLAQIDTLKNDLNQRQTEIEGLKATVASAGANSGLSAEEKAKLEAQLKELANKLAEYEIISEDIADLSFYKEENAKLAKQLEALKTGGGSAPAAAAPAPPAPVPPPAAKAEPEIVGKAKVKEVEVAPAPAPQPEAAPSPESAPAAAPIAGAVDDDLMAEFAKAIQDQKGTGGASAPSSQPPNPVPATDVAEPSLGSMDMDKMLAEASGLEANVSGDTPVNALESGLDESKLLQEADALEAAPAVKSDDKNLMNEFESFVKKGG